MRGYFNNVERKRFRKQAAAPNRNNSVIGSLAVREFSVVWEYGCVVLSSLGEDVEAEEAGHFSAP